MSQSCRLTGGFALIFYLPGSPYAGDFTFTVGGYHPRYKPPAHYPSAPLGVGISWKYDNDLYICGEAYFTITPQAVMGGGRLDIVLDKGWVRASFSAYADFFMNFHPFYFEADVGVSIYASVSIGKGWFSIHLGPLEFTASLSLHGPPIAGTAHLHLWTYSVTVCFGPGPAPPPALGWTDFLRLVKNLQKGEDETKMTNFMFTITQGEITPGSADAGATPAQGVSNVRAAQFKFQVETRVLVIAAVIGPAGKSVISTDDAGNPWTPQVYATPMQLGSPFSGSDLSILLKRESTDELAPLKGTPMFKKLPPALWGECKCSIFSSVVYPACPRRTEEKKKKSAKVLM